jgi:hypothetical protein
MSILERAIVYRIVDFKSGFIVDFKSGFKVCRIFLCGGGEYDDQKECSER